MKKVIGIEARERNGKTFLKKGYAAHPYKIADITEHRTSKALELMLMSSSPGILDGDHYHLQVQVGEGASLILKTQAYQRLFTMKYGASQLIEVQVDDGASFTYLPHPVVPHAGSHFTSKNYISVSGNSRLTWGEVITCGRKLNGEAFAFTFFQNLTEVFYNGKLVVRDNLVMKPASMPLHVMGKLEGFTHQASLLMIDECINTSELVALIHEWLSSAPGICYGVSALVVNGVIIRILGNKAEQLFQLLQSVSEKSSELNFASALIKPEVYVG